MKKSLFTMLILVAIFAMTFSACAPAAPAEEVPMEEAAPMEEESAEETAPMEETADGMPAACAADPAGCAMIPAGETVKVGMGAPMLGDYSMFGIDISQAVEYALLTDDGFEGWTYELVAEDTGGSPEAGAAVANKFVTESDMVAIAGHIFSGSTEAAMPIYEEAMFPMMSPSATLPSLTESGSTVFNRLCFTDAIQASFAAQMIAGDLGVTKLAVLHDGTSYGKGLADAVKSDFEASTGMEAVAYEAITPGESDYSAVLAAVAASGPEAVYFGGYSAEGIVMANQWAQSGLSDTTLFGADGVYGTEFTEKTGPNGEGAIAVSLVPPTTEEKAAFDAGYEEMFGIATGSLSAFTWSSYDVGQVIVAAIEKVAFVEGDMMYVPRTAVTEAMRATSFEGLTGLIECGETGECNASGPTFYVVADGEWIPWSADDSMAMEEEATMDAEATCAADPAGCAMIPAGETVKVGMGAPMLGDYSMFGIDISQAVEYALLTDDGFEGWTYELVAEDTGGSPEAGAAVANKFVTESDMVAIAGHIFSGSTEAAMPIYEEAMFPMMSPSATLPSLTESGSTVFNRLCFTDAIQASFAAQMIAGDLGVTKLAVLHDGTSYGKGLADAVKSDFEASTGMEAVAYEAITPGESDYSAVLAAVAASGPEAVYFGGYSAEGIVMANQWAQSGLSDTTLFGADGVYGTEFTEKTGPNGEGAIAVSLVPPTTEEKAAFDAGYEEMFGIATGSLSAFTWSSYDVGQVIVAAIEKVAFVEGDMMYVPRTAVTEAMRATSFEGLTGLIECGETGECNASGPTFYVVADGEWIPWSAE